MGKALLAALACAALAGCGPQSEAKNALKKLLNDPDSAQFSELQAGQQAGDVCGLFNAKNRMGGYAGSTPFFYQKATKTVAIAKLPEDSDFRMLYLSIGSTSFSDDYSKVSMQCRIVEQWSAVCKTPHPQNSNPLCNDLAAGGVVLYEKLRAQYK